MAVKKCFNPALLATQAMLNDYSYKCSNRVKPEYFSRNGKLGFKDTMLFMMNMIKKSLQVELNNFFEIVQKRGLPVSKQAYSEARQKIEPKAFIELNDRINKVIYEECSTYELWNGYRLSAIDGSILEIPNTETLRTEFGYAENQNGKTARARMSCLYDVVNNIVIKSKIDRYDSSERDIAKFLISSMIKDISKKELILFDRGYPSADFISFLFENGIDFVMRSKVNFTTAVINAKKVDQVAEIRYKQNTYPVRVLRVSLPSGVEEILITH